MGLSETFTVLANSRSADIKPALFEAMELPNPRIVQLSLDALFAQRIEADDVIELVAHLDDLSEAVQERLAASVVKIKEPLKELVRHGSDKERESLLDLLSRTTSPDIIDLLILFLPMEDEDQVTRSASHIEKVVQRFAKDLARAEVKDAEHADDPEHPSAVEHMKSDVRLMTSSLIRGLETFPIHKQKVIVKSAFSLGKLGYDILAEAIRHESRQLNVRDALIGEIIRSHGEETVRYALTQMDNDQAYYRKVGCDIIRGKTSKEDSDALIRVLRRVPRSTQHRYIRRTDDMPWLHLIRSRFQELGEDYPQYALEEVQSLSIPATDKVGLWFWLAQCGDPQVAMQAIIHLTKINAQEAKQAMEKLVDKGDEFAQAAAIKVMEQQGAPNFIRVVARKIDSEFESVRKIAAKSLAEQGYQRYRNAFEKLNSETRVLAGKTLLQVDPTVAEQIKKDLEDITPVRRVLAIRIIKVLGIEQQFEAEIQKMMADADARVRATTVKLLENLESEESFKLLVSKLSDPDARVQANAVETIEAKHPQNFRQILVPLLKSNHNRVRANAAKALWKLGVKEVLPFMFKMLTEESQKMRISGAWLMQVCGPPEAEAKLQAAIKAETGHVVRQRLVDSLKALQSGGANIGREMTDVLDEDELAGLGFGVGIVPDGKGDA